MCVPRNIERFYSECKCDNSYTYPWNCHPSHCVGEEKGDKRERGGKCPTERELENGEREKKKGEVWDLQDVRFLSLSPFLSFFLSLSLTVTLSFQEAYKAVERIVRPFFHSGGASLPLSPLLLRGERGSRKVALIHQVLSFFLLFVFSFFSRILTFLFSFFWNTACLAIQRAHSHN